MSSRRANARAHRRRPRERGEQPGILKDRLAHGDAVLTELARLSDQPGSMGKCPHWNWSVIGRHAAKFVAGNECRLGAQVGRTVRGEHTGRSCANNDDVHHSHSPLKRHHDAG